MPVLEPVAFVRSVTEGFGRGAPTSAQHNDFRRFAVLAQRGRQFPPVRCHNPYRALDDEWAVRLGSDGYGGHAGNIMTVTERISGTVRAGSGIFCVRRSLLIFCVGLSACIGERGPLTNRMAHSGTGYLTRAARQPVRWQPWGRDAFVLAARLDRPILLYVGSDNCRWCAETDRAIYADPEIGGLINALFVPVRVDRDERPDIAHHYQIAVEHLAGLRGWPLTVFLTADGAAFFGGTYFPADDPVTGRGLKQLLPAVAKSYHEQRAFVIQQAALVRELARSGDPASRGTLGPSLVQEGIIAVMRDLDEAVRNRTAGGSVLYAEAVSLLLEDTSAQARASALRALDVMLDTTTSLVDEDPPLLVRAALAGDLAAAWGATSEPRYREAGRALVRTLSTELPTEGVFADQQAYVIGTLLNSAVVFGDSAAANRARGALDALLQQTYARGFGVQHAVQALSGASPPQALQDQVELGLACLAADGGGGDPRYEDVAVDLAAIIQRNYADSSGGYFDTAEGIDRAKYVLDDVLPGANARAALFLEHLARVTGDRTYRHRAQSALEIFAGAAQGGVGIRATTFLAATRQFLDIP